MLLIADGLSQRNKRGTPGLFSVGCSTLDGVLRESLYYVRGRFPCCRGSDGHFSICRSRFVGHDLMKWMAERLLLIPLGSGLLEAAGLSQRGCGNSCEFSVWFVKSVRKSS